MNEDTQELSPEDRILKLEKIQEKVMHTLQGMVNTINDLRQRSENSQVILSSILKTIADGRPLDPSQLRESHHQLTSEKVNKIFNNAVKVGIIEPVDTIVEDSIVIVQEFDANGVELHRASEFSMADLSVHEDTKSLFRSKKVGDRVALFKDGQLASTYVVQSVFKPLEKVEKTYNDETAPTEVTTDNQTTPS